MSAFSATNGDLAFLDGAITPADEVGLDVFGIGEHHRREFLDSAPTVILAAAQPEPILSA